MSLFGDINRGLSKIVQPVFDVTKDIRAKVMPDAISDPIDKIGQWAASNPLEAAAIAAGAAMGAGAATGGGAGGGLLGGAATRGTSALTAPLTPVSPSFGAGFSGIMNPNAGLSAASQQMGGEIASTIGQGSSVIMNPNLPAQTQAAASLLPKPSSGFTQKLFTGLLDDSSSIASIANGRQSPNISAPGGSVQQPGFQPNANPYLVFQRRRTHA